MLLWRACLLTRSRTVSATDSPIGLESSIACRLDNSISGGSVGVADPSALIAKSRHVMVVNCSHSPSPVSYYSRLCTRHMYCICSAHERVRWAKAAQADKRAQVCQAARGTHGVGKCGSSRDVCSRIFVAGSDGAEADSRERRQTVNASILRAGYDASRSRSRSRSGSGSRSVSGSRSGSWSRSGSGSRSWSGSGSRSWSRSWSGSI